MQPKENPKHPDAPVGAHYEELKMENDRWVLSEGPRSGAGGLVPAVDKAIRILAFINGTKAELTLAEIADKTAITKSHCHAILKTLAYHNWLYFDPTRKTYRLSIGIQRDLSGMMHDTTPLSVIKPLVEELSSRINVSCILSGLSPDGGFVVVAKASAPNQIEISYPIGHRFPRDASAQMKARLAWVTEDEVAAWFREWKPVKYAGMTSLDQDDIKAELQATRLRGYSRSIGEFTQGLTAIALPVFDSDGKVIFILDCLGLSLTMALHETDIAEHTIQTVKAIHQLISGKPPKGFPEN